jgi:Tectonin domain
MSEPLVTFPEKLTLSDIAVASDGTAWAIDSTGLVLACDGDQPAWRPVTGAPALTGVAVGNAKEIWGVTADGEASRFDAASGTWEPMGSGFTQVSCGADGEVWGVSGDGYLRRRSGAGWAEVPGVLAQIAVGSADAVWGLTDAGGTFHHESGQWRQVAGRLAQVSVGADGTALGVDPDGGLWWYAPDQDAWVYGDATCRRVGVGSAEQIWLITPGGQPFPLTGPAIEEGQRQQRQPAGGVVVFWDAESVYDETASTHLWIVNRAAELAVQAGPTGQRISDLVRPGAGQTEDAFHNNLCQGLYDADFVAAYNDPFPIPLPLSGEAVNVQPTYKSHFYDPTTGENYWHETEPTAMTQGVRYFQESLAAYQAEDAAQAGYKLGLSLHYFTDLTQPMHSANYTALDWPFKYHTTFESYVMTIQQDAAVPRSYAYTDRGPESTGYLLAAARTSRAHIDQVCPPEIRNLPIGSVPDLDRLGVRQAVLGAVLPDAIRLAADYLVTWMTRAEQARTNPLGVYYQGGGQNGQVTYTRGGDQHWSVPSSVPRTRMSGSPAVAEYKNLLYCFHQGDGKNSQLWYNTFDGHDWLGDRQVPGTKMSKSPALAQFKDLLYCFHQGQSENGELWYNTFDGHNWLGDRQVPGTGTSESPGLVVGWNQLFCFHQGTGRSGELWLNTFDGHQWSGDHRIGDVSVSGAPAAVLFTPQV